MKIFPSSARAIPAIAYSNHEVLWLKPGNRQEISREITRLRAKGNGCFRLGIDCKEFLTEEGGFWYDWLVPILAKHFQLELCFDNFSNAKAYSISLGHDLAEIIEHFILKHGDCFTRVELWRNPSTREEQDNLSNIFACDVVFAASWAIHLGKQVKLGRIQTLDFEWITKLVVSPFLSKILCIEIDKIGEDRWRTETNYFERTLRSLFNAHGIKTDIYPSSFAVVKQIGIAEK